MRAASKTGRARARAGAGVFVVLGLGLAVAGPIAGPASAQPDTCPNPREGDVTVEIALPEAGVTVSGVVQVEGSVTASEPVFQVELFVGDARRDVVVFEPPVAEAPFALRWDATSRPPGPATIEVVACGGVPAEGSLVRGAGTVDVVVGDTGAGPRTGGTLTEPTGPTGPEWAPAWVGLAFGAAAVAGLAYALMRSTDDG